MERLRRTGTGRWITAAVLLAALGAGTAAAGDDPGFLRTEREVTGGSLSGSWRDLGQAGRAFEQIGGDGLDQTPKGGGGAGLADQPGVVGDDAPSVSGEKIKAGVLSLILPGAGQFYNGERKKAYIMAGIEAGIWITYFVFDAQGDNAMESSREYSGIYAGTGGDHPDSYWQAVGRYLDSDEYEDYLRREARATEQPLPPPLAPEDTWQWVNDDRKYNYQSLRADANAAYDRRDYMILFAVVNRAVSIVDAVIGAGKVDGQLETEVLGMNLSLGMLPSWQDPGARCTVARSF